MPMKSWSRISTYEEESCWESGDFYTSAVKGTFALDVMDLISIAEKMA